ncbi:ATP-binding protein [Pectobacterium versatile]|uniref:ATP-binding protein n=1 Tax=Pectobacterium versatile TaxID=2488639 RepID=UPI00102EB0D3|nr:ATP-binding protein [Pectobacterium versatile]TAI97899.1 ATP-binding protein [Pectobacterium versatile]UEQ08780.1 ATP-binding protein [Pectobacterium versatile]
MAKHSPLHFRISSGLKRIIGRDLITNDFVAVFELVKNSFDARSTEVNIIFENDRLFIIDNGKGMSYDDLVNKWLFVAYSAKKDGTEDEDYRNNLSSTAAYAGSKGVGRFSCDKLGTGLKMQTRSRLSDSREVHVLNIDWNTFEHNDLNDFIDVDVLHSIETSFSVPATIESIQHGTVLEIISPREQWNREKILSLKSALAKLINPFNDSTSNFNIYIHSKNDLEEDERIKSRIDINNLFNEDNEELEDSELEQRVNGKVGNFVFEKLKEKTTHLNVKISDNGDKIISELTDRGELIYLIEEPNIYKTLHNSDFSFNIFYLNRAAKNTFKRRMGIESVRFGSLFLFRNGFRVYPVGEEGDDVFGIDRRKQQGYARYLGTRDIVGRIDVKGSEENFRESTSRDQGLIETPAYLELRECLWEKCIKRLESYVVGVSWQDSLDSTTEDISRLIGDKAKARIIDIVSKLANGEKINLIKYSRNLITILNEKSEDFSNSIANLRVLAGKVGNQDLVSQIAKAEIRYQELKNAESLARIQAEKEKRARQEAELRAREAELLKNRADIERQKTEESKRKLEVAYQEEVKRNLFLTSVTSVDHDTIVNLHHQIGIYSADIHHLLANQVDKLNHKEQIDPDNLLSLLEQLTFKNQQILSISRFATKANFRLDSEKIEADLAMFITDYIDNICKFYSGDGLNISVNSTAKGLNRSFKPIEIAILIDNLVNNAEKASASNVDFTITQTTAKQIEILVTDDGKGLEETIQEPDRIFEKGYSTTDGSGLGLYHISYILDQMGGGISVNSQYKNGLQLIIRIIE